MLLRHHLLLFLLVISVALVQGGWGLPNLFKVWRTENSKRLDDMLEALTNDHLDPVTRYKLLHGEFTNLIDAVKHGNMDDVTRFTKDNAFLHLCDNVGFHRKGSSSNV